MVKEFVEWIRVRLATVLKEYRQLLGKRSLLQRGKQSLSLFLWTLVKATVLLQPPFWPM
jgi:hypothetical protein